MEPLRAIRHRAEFDRPAGRSPDGKPLLRIVAPDEFAGPAEPAAIPIDAMTIDDLLISSLVAGHAAALGSLYDRHAGIVFGILLRIVGEREAAEELLQEVFLRAWQQAAAFDRSRGTVRHWLNGIAHNLALNELRRRRRRPQAAAGPFADGEDDPFCDCVDPTPELVEVAWCSERDARLLHALDRLSPAQRDVIELYAVGFSQSEIATKLGEPLGTVKSRMRRGLRQLREVLVLDGIDASSCVD